MSGVVWRRAMGGRNPVIRILLRAARGSLSVLYLAEFCFSCPWHPAGPCCTFSFSVPLQPWNTSDSRRWGKYHGWTRRLLEAIEGTGSTDDRPDLLGNIALNLGVRPRPLPTPNLREPTKLLDFFASSPDFALFPHLSRNTLTASAKIHGVQVRSAPAHPA